MVAQPTTITQVRPVVGVPRTLSFDSSYLNAKRALDLAVTILILAPFGLIIMLLVALAVRLDSPGPVFYRQRRFGAGGETFEILKFRSMYHGSKDDVHRKATEKFIEGQALNDDPSGARYKLAKDPRITRVGAFIRKTSLDEFPQFINVLRGEMSLVGPRPPVAYEVDKYSRRDMLRLAGKPGVTGLWQVCSRSNVNFRTMVEIDIAYLEQQSLWLDIKLIFLTPLAVLRKTGAA